MSDRMLKLASDLSLPLDVVTEKLAFLGRTGGGKSYAATKLAELMLEAGAQVLAVDPVGTWAGLRMGTRFKIYIFGGLHHDVPLEPTSGAHIANVIADRGISVVLDVSQWVQAEQIRFMTAFATQFFQRKKAAPSAVHLFVEECQEFIPQNPDAGETRMLHEFNRLWKLGRNFGIGGSLISQRPQEVNKKALNQAGTLFVFQMTAPQERKAIEGWVAEKGIDEDIKAVLPRLKIGEPHVWSPSFLHVSRTVRILRKKSADTSSTPQVRSRATERSLTPIDLARLTKDMAATLERAKAEDPRELRRKLSELNRELVLAQAKRGQPAPKVQRVEVPVLQASQLRALDRATDRLAKAGAQLVDVGALVATSSRELVEALKRVRNGNEPPAHRSAAQSTPPTPPHVRRPDPARSAGGPRQEGMTNPKQRLLDALAWLESIGNADPEDTAVAFLASYTAGGGTFNNVRGRLRQEGYLVYEPGSRLRLTPAGLAAAHVPDQVLTSEELHTRILERLPEPLRRILRPLLAAYPDALSYDELADQAKYAPGGTFNNGRGRLRTLGLVEYPQPGYAVARAVLFLGN